MSSLWFAPYEREFSQPLIYGNKKISVRRGVCVRWDVDSHSIYGEASPLEGHSSETTEDVIYFLSKSAKALAGFSESSNFSQSSFPSVEFCFNGLQKQKKLLSGCVGSVRSNALVAWTNPEATLQQIREKASLGYKVIKLKVFPDNARAVLDLVAAAPAGVLFRLDGNRSLDKKAVRLFSSLAAKIDYFEEPFESWSEIDPSLGLVFAADESANNAESLAAILRQNPPPEVLVIKPTISGLMMLPALRTIFTSSLEAEPGRRSLLAYLMSLGSREFHGISTGFLLRDNFMPDLPEYSSIPPVGEAEQAWLNSLQWRKIV